MKSARIVHLDPATRGGLAAGELPLASPAPLADHLTGPEHRPLLRLTGRQTAADPAAAARISGVVWAPTIGDPREPPAGGDGIMPVVSAFSGPVPGGLRMAFVVLTVAAIALAVFAAFRGVWFLTTICGLFAVLNLGVLWTTRSATVDRPDQRSGSSAD